MSIRWSPEEWTALFEHMERHPDTAPLSRRLVNAQSCLPRSRQRSEISIMTSSVVNARQYEWYKAAKGPLRTPLPEPQPAQEKLSFDDLLWRTFEPRLRSLIREEIALGLLGRADQANVVRKKLGTLYESTSPEEIRSHVKVDVLGLLPAQAEQVLASDVGQRVDLRFIKDGGDSASYRENVIVVTKFVSHAAINRAKACGSNLIYVNGAAISVISALEQLLYQLATRDIP